MRGTILHTTKGNRPSWSKKTNEQTGEEDTVENATLASEAMSINTLTGFLIDSTSQVLSPRMSSTQRHQNEETTATINALNQFIFQAGNIYRGKKLGRDEENKLQEAAQLVGLPAEVVDALLEQTADPNAVVKYCMASNDAIARTIKKDPHLSRLLEEGRNHSSGDSFDLANSIWRVFMHKIVQKILKDHQIELGDVMVKSSLTSQLYEQALQNDPRTSGYGNRFADFVTIPSDAVKLPRDFTQERKQVSIPESEAKKARQAAEAMMKFEPHRPFHEILRGDEMPMIIGDKAPDCRDDDLSLIPGAYRSNGGSESGETKLAQRKKIESTPEGGRIIRRECGTDFASPGRGKRQSVSTSPDDQPLSAVKRGLSMFQKSTIETRSSEPKFQRTLSHGKKPSSDVASARALFEGTNKNVESITPERRMDTNSTAGSVPGRRSSSSKRGRSKSSSKVASACAIFGQEKSQGSMTPRSDRNALNPGVSVSNISKVEASRLAAYEKGEASNRENSNKKSGRTPKKLDGSAIKVFLRQEGSTREGSISSKRSQITPKYFNDSLDSVKQPAMSIQHFSQYSGDDDDCDFRQSSSEDTEPILGRTRLLNPRPDSVSVEANNEDVVAVYSSLTQSSESSDEANPLRATKRRGDFHLPSHNQMVDQKNSRKTAQEVSGTQKRSDIGNTKKLGGTGFNRHKESKQERWTVFESSQDFRRVAAGVKHAHVEKGVANQENNTLSTNESIKRKSHLKHGRKKFGCIKEYPGAQSVSISSYPVARSFQTVPTPRAATVVTNCSEEFENEGNQKTGKGRVSDQPPALREIFVQGERDRRSQNRCEFESIFPSDESKNSGFPNDSGSRTNFNRISLDKSSRWVEFENTTVPRNYRDPGQREKYLQQTNSNWSQQPRNDGAVSSVPSIEMTPSTSTTRVFFEKLMKESDNDSSQQSQNARTVSKDPSDTTASAENSRAFFENLESESGRTPKNIAKPDRSAKEPPSSGNDQVQSWTNRANFSERKGTTEKSVRNQKLASDTQQLPRQQQFGNQWTTFHDDCFRQQTVVPRNWRNPQSASNAAQDIAVKTDGTSYTNERNDWPPKSINITGSESQSELTTSGDDVLSNQPNENEPLSHTEEWEGRYSKPTQYSAQTDFSKPAKARSAGKQKYSMKPFLQFDQNDGRIQVFRADMNPNIPPNGLEFGQSIQKGSKHTVDPRNTMGTESKSNALNNLKKMGEDTSQENDFKGLNPIHNHETETTRTMSTESDSNAFNFYDVPESQDHHQDLRQEHTAHVYPQRFVYSNPVYLNPGVRDLQAHYQQNLQEENSNVLYSLQGVPVVQGNPVIPGNEPMSTQVVAPHYQLNPNQRLYGRDTHGANVLQGNLAREPRAVGSGAKAYNGVHSNTVYHHNTRPPVEQHSANPVVFSMNVMQASCKVEEEKNGGCLVNGRPLIEASFKPMNGGSPTKTPFQSKPEWEVFEEGDTTWDTEGDGNQTFKSSESEFDALNTFLDEFKYDGKPQPAATPHTPAGIQKQVSSDQGYSEDVSVKKPLPPMPSNMPNVETVCSPEEDDNVAHGHSDGYGYLGSHERSENALDRPISKDNSELDEFEGRDRYDDYHPTSPTALRSDDSESIVDEAEIRAAARESGIHSSVVDVILRQAKLETKAATETPFDSDTCRPASARHLQKDVGPQPSQVHPGHKSRGAIHPGDSYDCEMNKMTRPCVAAMSPRCATRDPPPRKRSATPTNGLPTEVPEGATEEEIKLLNRFIEVAAANFDGKRLSKESEEKVRSAALKVGLSEKFVDQLLEQAQARKENQPTYAGSIPMVGGDNGRYHHPDSPDTRGGASTYYTVDYTRATKRRKKAADATVVGCPSWWETINTNIKSWANCGDDGSSISTVPSIAWEDERPRTPVVPGKDDGKSKVRALV